VTSRTRSSAFPSPASKAEAECLQLYGRNDLKMLDQNWP
jgi:hypothetical protein